MSSDAARRRWQEFSRRPFPRLVQLFAGRVFHGSGDAGESSDELDLSLGLILSLLALPGGFFSILLFNKYGSLLRWMRGDRSFDPLAAALPDQYFFIVLAMVVTGSVAVWRWESIFPDRRDFANLVPLPIATRTIFLANLVAILFLAGLLALDVNAASGILFPLVVSASQETFRYFLEFAAVHILSVLSASLFAFFAVFSFVGLLMALLPYSVFRRISLFVRCATMTCLVAMLSTSFIVPTLLPRLSESSIRYLPPVWFLGLSQLVRGQTGPLADLGRTALFALTCSVLVAVAAYAMSYARCFARIPETLNVSSERSRSSSTWLLSALDRTILRTPFQRAGYRFVFRTLVRSERHSLVLGGFLGFGLVIAAQTLFTAFNHNPGTGFAVPSVEILSVPFILIYCILVGLRFVFGIPTDLRANWIFQLLLNKARHECIPLARKVSMSFILPWVFAFVLPVHAWLWGWTSAVLHATVITAAALLLSKVLFGGLRKVPFTCSYPPFRESAIVLVLSYVLGFFVFVFPIAQFEYWALLKPSLMLILFPVGLVTWYLLSRLQGETMEIDRQLIFEEVSPAAFEVLDLNRGS